MKTLKKRNRFKGGGSSENSSSELKKVQREIRRLKGESVSKSSSEDELKKVRKEIDELQKSMKISKSSSKKLSKSVSKPFPKGKSHPSRSISVRSRDIPSRASYKSKSTSHSPEEAMEINELKKKYNDKYFERYNDVSVIDLSLNNDKEVVKLSDLKKMVSSEVSIDEGVSIDVLIKELTDSGKWNISSGMLITALFSILYLSIKFKHLLCVPEGKLAYNVLNNPMLHSNNYYLLEYRKTIDFAPPGRPSPNTNEGFQELLNYIMDNAEQNEPQHFPNGFFSTLGSFGGTYRDKILRYFKDENSSTIIYDPNWWEFISRPLDIPSEQMVRIGELLNGLTNKKLVYNRDYLSKYFKKCLKKNKRFVVMHLGLPRHANCLIYDKEKHELERFEPHGAVMYDEQEQHIDQQIEELFISGSDPIIGGHARYFSPPDYCPIGPQALPIEKGDGDPGGFCHWWTVYYMDLRLSNPDTDRSTLLQKAQSSMEGRMFVDLLRGKRDEDISWDFNKFMRTYGAYLNISEAYLRQVLDDNDPDPYGILMNEAMEHFIKQVL